MSSHLEFRVIHLEEQSYFQEQTLRDLHEALLRQQRQLDTLEHHLAEQKDLLRRLADMLENSKEHSLPPHSIPERY